jgi:hypothetical protein
MKTPEIINLNIPALLSQAAKLPSAGILNVSSSNLTYLDIDDEYIHRLFPLLSQYDVQKPDYFKSGSEGAHITVVYPEENIAISRAMLNQTHAFTPTQIVTATIGLKTYYALLVDSPDLLNIRRKYNLPDLLNFRGYGMGFHITLGVKATLGIA